MKPFLPNYIQKRIDINSERINEIKILLEDTDDVDLYAEMVFLKGENNTLMGTNYKTQTYIEPIVNKVENKPEFDETFPIISSGRTGTELEKRAEEIYGEQLYQVKKGDNASSYIAETDMALFERYNIKFMNGLAVNIDIDNTPKFVLERIRKTNVYERLLNKTGYQNSEIWSEGEKIEKIWFESEIDGDTFKNINNLDRSVEDVRDYEDYGNKKLILVQIKPDYAVSNDNRYTVMAEMLESIDEEGNIVKFHDIYHKLKDKSKEYGIPTYVKK